MKFIDLNNLKENLENFLNTVLLNIFPTKEEVQTNLDSKLSAEDINLFVPLQNDITRTVYGLKINISYLDTTENCKVTLNGKATNDIEFFIANSNIPFGNLSGGTSKCKIIEMYTDDNGMTQKNIDSGDGCILKGKGNIYLSISNGTSFSNEVIYPKIIGDKNSIGKSLIINDSENYINKAMRTGFIEGDNNLGIMTYTPSDGSVFTNNYKDTVYPKLYSSFSLYSYMISQLQDENHTDYNIYNNHAEGKYTIARGDCQFVEGKYNIEDEDDNYAHIVGGGTSEDNRKNIHTLDWEGNAEFAGDVTATSSTGDKISLISIQKKTATHENYWNGTQKWIKLFSLSPAASNIGDSMKFIISSRNHYEEVSISVTTDGASPTGIGIIDFTTNLKEGTSLIVAYHNKVENLIDVFYASTEIWDSSNFNIVHHITSSRIVCTVHNTDSTIPEETENYVKHLPTSKFVELDERISNNGYGEVAGGKNLVNLDYDSLLDKESTYGGISFSYVSPNCIKLKGTSTHDYSQCYMTLLSPTIKDNEGIFSHGKSLTISTTKGYIALYANAGAGWIGLGCYKNFNINIQPEWISLLIRICAKDIGETYNNDLAYIQIEEGSVATEYEPYFPSNKMLAEEKADKSETTVNLLNPTLGTTTVNGITCTNNGDGTYTLNGTATAETYMDIGRCTIKDTQYKLLGCPPTGGYEKYVLYLSDRMQPDITDTGNGVILQKEATSYPIKIGIWPGVTLNNVIFKPMITTNLNATYDDFVPYTGDTGKLNSDVAKLKNDLDKLNSLPIGSIIQIEAAKDDIETTTQKYGWQYLGTSNIQYESGSATLLVTNVYRKND